MTNNERTTCLVVGGGPAGMFLGLLMARAGVEVTVLEKHADFLRDFRGDTVHASTLTLLDELGLGERFARIPHRLLDRVQVQLDEGSFAIGDLRRLPGAHKHIALVPQWDLLDLLAASAEEEPTFTLRRNAEARDLLWDGSRVAGVRYVDRETGAEHELRASVTVGCDGRGSAIRAAAGLQSRSFGVPMDVWWFRLPRHADDPTGGVGRFSTGHFCVLIDRGDYWQCGYLIRKGSDATLRAAGIEELRRRFVGLLPWLADRIDHLRSWDDVRLLDVRLDRLRRWDRDGLLLIGDAAHAMSPVGGVGINLAVQDAVAAARVLGPALASGGIVPRSMLQRVQRRRWWPTVLIQGLQRLAHRAVLGQALADAPAAPARSEGAAVRADAPAAGSDGADARADAPAAGSDGADARADGSAGGSPGAAAAPTLAPAAGSPVAPRASGISDAGPVATPPGPIGLLTRFPWLQGIPARLIAIGPLPEHAPAWARRPTESPTPKPG
jgi:2-polyprenyl-6-methoxyphenol hydroxylase-like FAD-dependent oxidoreductase